MESSYKMCGSIKRYLSLYVNYFVSDLCRELLRP